MIRSLASASSRSTVDRLLFALAVFTSAALVFVVQPMITKMILPKLGGSAAVWNTSMVFFQAALLAGYAYAHLLQRLKRLRSQALVHLALLTAAALVLPLRVTALLGDPDPHAPTVWLLGVLALSVGAPFAVLSATAPLVQAWFARVRAGESDARNPYVLYAASNLGSFAALILYPLAVEPLLTLDAQRWAWTVGYALFAALMALLGGLTRKAGDAEPLPLEPGPAPSWTLRLTWLLLAAAPASLLLGVTAHLTTDVASAPFLWVVPLALYLLTFVVAFQDKPVIRPQTALVLQAVAVAAVAAFLPFKTGEWGLLFLLHATGFFLTTLVCHQALAARRPHPGRLTEFYLWLSLGGVVGGALTALVAPVVFDMVREYPLVLVLAALARPWRGPMERWRQAVFAVALIAAVAPWIWIWAYQSPWNPPFHDAPFQTVETVSRVVLFVAGALAFFLRDRAWLFMVLLGAISVSAHASAGRYNVVETERSFFGVIRTATYRDPDGGPALMMLHGTTLHGAQYTADPNRCAPTTYYALTTPIGRVMLNVRSTHPEGARMGVVGLGTGALATYVRDIDRMTYFEIDPAVVPFALGAAKGRFSFIEECAEGPVDMVLGDARLTLERYTAASFDVLVIDAFSSDAVPTHLLTLEAITGYLERIRPDGVVVLHLSNRNIELARPTIAAARAAGGHVLHGVYYTQAGAGTLSDSSQEVVLVARDPQAFARFRGEPDWTENPSDEGVRPWTDDYTNLISAIWRKAEDRARSRAAASGG